MNIRLFAILLVPLALLLAGCRGDPNRQDARAVGALNAYGSRPRPQPVKYIGAPYYMNGQLYRPRHQPDYEATGTAALRSDADTGKVTANGELFDSQNVFAGHPTLPLPSYVEIENLDNGRQLTVRVNDRGHFKPGQIISVSSRVAEILDFAHTEARVRVRYLSPAPVTPIGRNR